MDMRTVVAEGERPYFEAMACGRAIECPSCSLYDVTVVEDFVPVFRRDDEVLEVVVRYRGVGLCVLNPWKAHAIHLLTFRRFAAQDFPRRRPPYVVFSG